MLSSLPKYKVIVKTGDDLVTALDPKAFGEWTTMQVHGGFGKAYRPEAWRGALGSTVFQFGQWPLLITKNLIHMARAGASNKTAAGKGVGVDEVIEAIVEKVVR